MKPLYIITIIAALTVCNGCQNFVEIGAPKTESISSTVFADDLGATSAVRGIYHELVRSGFASGQQVSVTLLAGASSDEFISYNASMDEFANNSVLPGSSTNATIWSSLYKAIYYCNNVLEKLPVSGGVSTAAKTQLMGEVKFIRAFCYFHLVNLYGAVPLIVTTDYRVNSTAERKSKEEVWALISQDLNEAQTLLPADFLFSSGERVRATSWAATSMLARVQLYTGDWAKAEANSSAVIASSLFKLNTDLNSVFLKNSGDAILQLMPVVPTQNTNEGLAMIPPSATSLPPFVGLSNTLMTSFEAGDKRKTNWTASQVIAGTTVSYPTKYKVGKVGQPITEYSMVLRLAEQYLIRAEARVKQGKLNEAMADINSLRSRAGLVNIQIKITSPTASDLLLAIEQERRSELFSEWAHRWLDLKRTGRTTTVLSPIKPQWVPSKELYPLPQTELANDPSLNQNPGY